MGVTKLYDLPKGSKIYEQMMANIGKTFFKSDVDNDPIIFDHIDGAYSYCYLESKPKMVVHLSASTPLVKYKDGWKIAPHTAADHEEVKSEPSTNRA